MKRFVILDRPGGGPTADAIVVRDGFSWIGLFVPPLWLAWHRLWLAALVVAVAQGVLAWLGAPYFAASLALSLLVALEGPSLRTARARRRGLQEVAAMTAAHRDDAELLYFGSDTMSVASDDMSAPAVAPTPVAERPTAFGGWRPARSLLDTGVGR